MGALVTGMFSFAKPLHGLVLVKSKGSPWDICVEDLMLGNGSAHIFKPTQAGNGEQSCDTALWVSDCYSSVKEKRSRNKRREWEGERKAKGWHGSLWWSALLSPPSSFRSSTFAGGAAQLMVELCCSCCVAPWKGVCCVWHWSWYSGIRRVFSLESSEWLKGTSSVVPCCGFCNTWHFVSHLFVGWKTDKLKRKQRIAVTSSPGMG